MNWTFGDMGKTVVEHHSQPMVPHSTRWPSVLRGAAVGLVLGLAWAAVLGPLTDGPPSLQVSFVVYAVGFAVTGALVGAVRHRPEVVGLASAPFVLTVLSVVVGPKDGWLVLWACVFGGSGLLGGAVVGALYRLVRGPSIAEPSVAPDRRPL